jgi:hypothetical protein
MTIDLGSIAGLHARQHTVHAFCCHCDRWRELDLEILVQRGLGGRRLPLLVRCLRCGRRGMVQIRPPTPTRSAGGWMDPPTIHGLCEHVLAAPQAGL